jgi:hypothetical protein
MTNKMSRAKLLAIISITAFAGVALSSGRATGQAVRGRMELVGISVPFPERAGSDDGTDFAVQFMGDTHGSLETCG